MRGKEGERPEAAAEMSQPEYYGGGEEGDLASSSSAESVMAGQSEIESSRSW